MIQKFYCHSENKTRNSRRTAFCFQVPQVQRIRNGSSGCSKCSSSSREIKIELPVRVTRYSIIIQKFSWHSEKKRQILEGLISVFFFLPQVQRMRRGSSGRWKWSSSSRESKPDLPVQVTHYSIIIQKFFWHSEKKREILEGLLSVFMFHRYNG